MKLRSFLRRKYWSKTSIFCKSFIFFFVAGIVSCKNPKPYIFNYPSDFEFVVCPDFDEVFVILDTFYIQNPRISSEEEVIQEISFLKRFSYCITKSQDSTFLSQYDICGKLITYKISNSFPQALSIRNSNVFVSCTFGFFCFNPSGKQIEE